MPRLRRGKSVELGVGDKLEQASVRIAEVDVAAAAASARVALLWPRHDVDPVLLQMIDRLFDRPGPDEAEVAVSWFDRPLSIQSSEPGSVDVQLPVAKPVMAKPGVLLINLGTKDIPIERVRALPVGHGDDAMVDHDAERHPTMLTDSWRRASRR
jgi:hypothetical protein